MQKISDLPQIPRLTYKYYLAKTGEKDSFETYAKYYKKHVEKSFFNCPEWLQDATIKAAFPYRFINHIF